MMLVCLLISSCLYPYVDFVSLRVMPGKRDLTQHTINSSEEHLKNDISDQGDIVKIYFTNRISLFCHPDLCISFSTLTLTDETFY